jgi:hypothetical protein
MELPLDPVAVATLVNREVSHGLTSALSAKSGLSRMAENLHCFVPVLERVCYWRQNDFQLLTRIQDAL